MSTKTLSSLVLPSLNKLAVDLDFFSTRLAGQTYVQVAGINATGSLVTVLSLTGKFLIETLYISGMSTTDIDQWKMTIDGVVIHDTDGMTRTFTTALAFGQLDGDNGSQMIICDSSFLLEIEMASDTSIDMRYRIRAIL